MAEYFIGWEGGGIPIRKSAVSRLVKVSSATDAFEKVADTTVQMVTLLYDHRFFLTGRDALRSPEAQMALAVTNLLLGQSVVVTNGVDNYTYREYFEGRVYSAHLESEKLRRRGIFVPGVKRSKNKNAQFMRIRVPHK